MKELSNPLRHRPQIWPSLFPDGFGGTMKIVQRQF